ncbi:hypothetical protein KGY79_08950 [Candidatus Bipolaricaulota bacterium]|nr:hypothetical protein [Candidatus Bipolaricaulota bacterium]
MGGKVGGVRDPLFYRLTDEKSPHIFGGSYGGYISYMYVQLVKKPEFWATGLAYAGLRI